MTTTYRVTTTGDNLSNNYSNVSGSWEFLFHINNEEVWEVQTATPTAFEQLLDTDSSVIRYSTEPGPGADRGRRVPLETIIAETEAKIAAGGSPDEIAKLESFLQFCKGGDPQERREIEEMKRRNGECDCGYCFDCVAQ